MNTQKDAAKVLVVGIDSGLSYLLHRYAERCSLAMIDASTSTALAEARKIHPSVILFSSLESLREAQAWMDELDELEGKILVCVAVGEEAAAREIGADGCLFHPLTFDGFFNALVSRCGA